MLKNTTTENGSAAYNWVYKNNVQLSMVEDVVQFYFQCIIGNKNDYNMLCQKYDDLFYKSMKNNDFKYVIKLCLQTRDIQDGKGLYEITYSMLETIVYYAYETKCLSKKVVFKIFKNMVRQRKGKPRPYGSWKDMKYFLCTFLDPSKFNYKFTKKCRHEIAKELIRKTYVVQMIKDRKNMSVSKSISLCGKWLPRESSKKFGHIGKLIAKQYHDVVFKTRVPDTEKFKTYRELIVKFNKYLDTTQIHMNTGEWSLINFNNVTSLTLLKSKRAFLNHKNINSDDRYICKENLTRYLNHKLETCGYLQVGNEIMPHRLVKSVILNPDNEEIKLLNMQWNGIVEHLTKNKNHFMKYCIPCIDVSPSMCCDDAVPLHCAIGMGLLCADVSHYNKAFTFSSHPTWFDFDSSSTFVEKVNQIKNGGWGSSTNIYALFMNVLEACQQANVSNDHLKEHSLIIFSDMQFDACDDNYTLDNDVFKHIKVKYQKCGYDDIPFLIFWNLRTTDNFPSIESTPNMLKLSGNSVSLLSILMDVELKELRSLSNWNIIQKILDNPRYNIVDHLL